MVTLAFNAGEEPAASKFDDLVSAWATATPAWTTSGTQPAIGNGTRITRFKQLGRICHFRIGFKFGSTTTFGTGQWSIGLPVTPKDPGSPFDSWETIGRWNSLDSSAGATGHRSGDVRRNTGAVAILWFQDNAIITVDTDSPYAAWGTGDYLNIWGSLETSD